MIWGLWKPPIVVSQKSPFVRPGSVVPQVLSNEVQALSLLALVGGHMDLRSAVITTEETKAGAAQGF